jgi:hypothetical protein
VRERLERYRRLLEVERDEGVLEALDALIRELRERNLLPERATHGAMWRTKAKRRAARLPR